MKVFLYRPHDRSQDAAALAFSEEGATLGYHVSSSLSFAKSDMQRYVPEGAEVVWVIGRAAMQEHIDRGEIRGLTFEDPAPAEIPLTPVKSSNVEAMGYDEATRTARIRFKGGQTYRYANVPKELYESVVASPSVGSAVHKSFKPLPCTKEDEE